MWRLPWRVHRRLRWLPVLGWSSLTWWLRSITSSGGTRRLRRRPFGGSGLARRSSRRLRRRQPQVSRYPNPNPDPNPTLP